MKRYCKRYGLLLLLVFSSHACVSAPAVEAQDESRHQASRYTFSWPLDDAYLKPRGGTTRGVPVTLDHQASAEWRALQEDGSSDFERDFERDRRAILAMAGTYRVAFDFLEIASFAANPEPQAPYQSWGTEKIYVDRDEGELISLVHILEMRFLQEDGEASEPVVVRHWRQQWQYQPKHIVEYRGRERWQRRALTDEEREGAWVLTVYQVDESPRYASVGRWRHSASFSDWLSAETWRPLPRREWSVRDDYQVLIGTNRHVILPSGWLQEENNLKAAVTDERTLDAAQPYVGREYGVARYERIRDADFAAADRYYWRTKHFWDAVRESWADAFAAHGEITLRAQVDQYGLFRPLFARADEIAEQELSPAPEDTEIIHATMRDMGVPE